MPLPDLIEMVPLPGPVTANVTVPGSKSITNRALILAALAGADAATLPADTFKALVKHPLTDKGLEQFLADWAKTGQTIA